MGLKQVEFTILAGDYGPALAVPTAMSFWPLRWKLTLGFSRPAASSQKFAAAQWRGTEKGCLLADYGGKMAQSVLSSADSSRCNQLDAQAASESLSAAGCRLAGCGSSVPEAVLTNADLEKLVETNDDWIASRTGIRSAARLSSLVQAAAFPYD